MSWVSTCVSNINVWKENSTMKIVKEGQQGANELEVPLESFKTKILQTYQTLHIELYVQKYGRKRIILFQNIFSCAIHKKIEP
jgi:hypothetical protein